MTALALVALVTCVVVALPPTSQSRLLRTFGGATTGTSATKSASPTRSITPALRRWVPLAALMLGLPVGGTRGVVLGVLAALLAAALIRLALLADERRAQQQLARCVPEVADLVALCLTAGADLHTGLPAIARSAPVAAREPLRRTAALLDLGVAPADAWAHWRGAATPLVRAFERSHRTGAPLAAECHRVALDMRTDEQARLQRLARSIGVRSVLPLMACFLPAFVLVGVVPVVVSLAAGLFSST